MQTREQPVPTLPDARTLNLPGIQTLWLIRATDVVSIADPLTAPQYQFSELILPVNAITFAAGAAVLVWQLLPGWCAYKETAAENDQGIRYKQTLSVSLPRDNPQTALALELMTGKHWLAVYQDRNGYLKLVGRKNQPCRFETDTQVGNSNSYTLNWVTETGRRAPFLAPADSLIFTSYLADDSVLDFTL